MMDIIRQITIAEIILLFVLLFVLPGMTYMLMQLRKYERRHGLPGATGKPPARNAPPAGGDESPAAAPAESVPDDVYPYRSRQLLSPADKACLLALREALGDEVEVFPKVAAWEMIEPTEQERGYLDRLRGRDFDFVVCDRKTGRQLTAVGYNPGKGRPAGPVDELRKICAAAECNIVFIDMAEEYDARTLKGELGIPELDD